jgi:hypothetical protein
MAERGYPMGDFDAQADLVSVDHPEVVDNYRSAHGIHEQAQEQQASTEDLREALVRYRSLFDELLRPNDDQARVPAARRLGTMADQTGPRVAAQTPPDEPTWSDDESEVPDERA